MMLPRYPEALNRAGTFGSRTFPRTACTTPLENETLVYHFTAPRRPSPASLLQSFVLAMNIQMSHDVITLYNYLCPWWWRRS